MRKIMIAGLMVTALFVLLYEYAPVHEVEQLQASFLAMPLADRVFAILFGVSIILFIPLGAFQYRRGRRQYRELEELKERFNGLRLALTMTARQQREAELAAQVIAGTDPEVTIMSLHKRITETECQIAVQKSYNDVPDLQERAQEIQRRQSDLREEIGKLIETRRAVAPLLSELNERQEQVEFSLNKLESLDGRKSLKEQLLDLIGDNANAKQRSDVAKETLATLNRLKDELDVYSNDLTRLRDKDMGIAAIVDLVRGSQIDVNRRLDKLESAGGEKLSICVERLIGDKRDAERRMAAIAEQVATMREVQQDTAILDRKRGHVEQVLAEAQVDETGCSIADRLTELNDFTREASRHIAVHQDVLRQLNEADAALTRSRAELEPLIRDHGGIRSLLAEASALRDELSRSLDELESSGGEVNLSGLVAELTEWKRAAELRIEAVNSHFTQLAAIEADIGALFTSVAGSLSAYVPHDAGGDGHSKVLSPDSASRWETVPQEPGSAETRHKISWMHIFRANGVPGGTTAFKKGAA